MLLKELQSLGLDVRVLRDDNTEVEIIENVDYGETDLRAVIEGDSRNRRGDDENFGRYGYTRQEFNESGELQDLEEDTHSSDDEDVSDDMLEFEEAYDDDGYDRKL